MKKLAGAVSVIAGGILFLSFGVQIVLGIVWMCLNMTHFQEFNVECGVLYRALRSAAGDCFGILYVLQLCAACCAGYLFLRRIHPGGRGWNLWGSLTLLTFPMAMQCHLSVSPYSLAGSLFLLELSFAIAAARGRESRVFIELAGVGGCWLVLTLFLPEYCCLGAVPLALAVLVRLPMFLRRLRRLGAAVLLIAAFAGLTVGAVRLTGGTMYLQTGESAAFAFFHRMTWPTLWIDHEGWPEEVRAVAAEQAWEVSRRADNPQRILRSVMRDRFGDELAAGYYLQMAKHSWDMHAYMIVRQIGWDALGYGATPLILPLQLAGEAYDSYSGRNYEFMINHTPLLTKYYVDYVCRFFGIMLVSAAFLLVSVLARRGAGAVRKLVAPVLICALSSAAVVAFYTMRGAGMMDYKCTIAVNLLWLAGALSLFTEAVQPVNGMKIESDFCL